MHSTQTLRRYTLLETIGSGGMGVVYRAFDRLQNQQVALKQVKANLASDALTDSHQLEMRLALAREFKLLASVRHPHIISVLDYGFADEQQPFITMQLLEQRATLLEAAHNTSPARKIALLNELLQALAYLHRRGILHRDLKPANVIVDHEVVKVLDFGLAQERSQSQAEEGLVGTLQYIAPELFEGHAASPASDLYAVGVMAYEMFVGKHPFDKAQSGAAAGVAALVNNILMNEPDMAAFKSLGQTWHTEDHRPTPTDVHERLANILERLLAKSPQMRYSSANEVIVAFSAALGQSPPPETIAIRESFLQAADFVGREAEMQQLSQALAALLRAEPSSWLISGESGAGKSRLMDELRTRALVQGAAVWRAQAIRERGQPYQMWREVLRWLIFSTPDISDSEASILKPLVGDIDTLLERTIALVDAPSLDPQAARNRFLQTIEDLVSRQTQPIVLILEDLQWATEENLLILQRLVALQHPTLMLVGNYRSDETPQLHEQLPQMQLIRLERLSETTIAALSASMLGEVGRDTPIVDFIYSTSEGNVFFVVELVRALAEEVGELRLIGQATLPASAFSGGMQAILQRRIGRIAAEYQPLLRLLAATGREFSPAILAAINDGQVNLDAFLVAATNANVLEVIGDAWRFTHDKLREALLHQQSSEAQRAAHTHIAQALERYLPANTAQLAYHWGQAGDRRKERAYAISASKEAYAGAAYRQAIEWAQRALELDPTKTLDSDTQALLQATIGLSHYALSELRQGIGYLRNAHEAIGLPYAEGWRFVPSLLIQLIEQAGRRLLRRPFIARPQTETHDTVLTGSIYLCVSVYILNQAWTSVYLSWLLLNRAERLGALYIYSWACTGIGFSVGVLGFHRLAEYYLERGYQSAKLHNNPVTIASSLQISGLYPITRGDWQRAERILSEARDLGQHIGSWRMAGDAAIFLAECYYYWGKFDAAQAAYASAIEWGKRSYNPLIVMWGILGLGMIALRRGQYDQAIPYIQEALERLEGLDQSRTHIVAHALMAHAQLQRGDLARAYHYAEIAQAKLSETIKRPAAHFLYDGYASLAMVYLGLLEAGYAQADLPSKAEHAVQGMLLYGKVFAIGAPRAAYCQALWLAQQGKRSEAKQALEAGLKHASALQMSYEEQLIQAKLEELSR